MKNKNKKRKKSRKLNTIKKGKKYRGQRKTEKAIIKVIKRLIKKRICPKIEKLLTDFTAYVNKK